MIPVERPSEELASLSNRLVTVEQLSMTSSRLDGISPDLEASIRHAGCCLTQQAGILLRLPQDIVAQAIVTFTRFYAGGEGGSFRVHAAKDISAASLYLTAKISPLPITPRSTLMVYNYLLSSGSAPPQEPAKINSEFPSQDDIGAAFLSEGAYIASRQFLMQNETLILRTLSFDTSVHLPYHLALTYLQTLGTLPSTPTARSRKLASRTVEHLNTGLLSPQMLYLTHQPNALAVASVYLAARETGVKLVECEWWEIFDVDREELGFLVMSFRSCKAWVIEERDQWQGKKSLLTVEGINKEINRRNTTADSD